MAAKLAITDLLALPNSAVKIPQLGFGVYLSNDKQCVTSCLAALKAGYRHIDTAQFYGNEKEVGEAVRQSGLKRESVFITTKIWSAKGSPEKTYQSLLDSVKTIEGTDDGAVDLFLIHQAHGGKAARKEMWLALEKLLAAGKARSIGVSNYGVGHIEEMKEYAKIWPPHVNQLEV
jgi:diketogulonate reductase-like aldo/keto reductase